MTTRRTPVSPATFARRLRKQRERASWDWTLDLSGVRTKADFVAVVREHIRERVRAGFIGAMRVTAGARFWSSLNEVLDSYFGNIRVRVLGWDGFERRQQDYARKLQTNFLLLRRERGAAAFHVEYDREPAASVRPRTFIRYFFLGPKCKLTLAGLAGGLRKHEWGTPVTILQTVRVGVEFEFGLEGTRKLKRSACLELDFGGYRLHLTVNGSWAQVARLRQYLVENYAETDPHLLARCNSVLEMWSWDDDPRGQFGQPRQAVLDLVRALFDDLYLEEDDVLTA
jgi:hypothetical protein